MKILALCGSLRAASWNWLLLRAAVRLAPEQIEVRLFAGMADLPLFNPDLESADPAPVAALRGELLAADAVVIASPEYAHGVSGVIKNALDWMVGNESFVGKPVAVWNASPRASHSRAALLEILTTMSARIVADACIEVPLLGSGLDLDRIVGQALFADLIRSAVRALVRAAAGEHPADRELSTSR